MAVGALLKVGWPALDELRGLQVLWALLYTGALALVLEHRVLTPLRMAGRHRMRVAAVLPEGPGVVSIVVEGRDLHELRAEAGQFFRWRFLTPDLWLTAHASSATSTSAPRPACPALCGRP